MQSPPEIKYIGVEGTEATDTLIQKRLADLEKTSNSIVSASVWVRSYIGRHQTGNAYQVRIDIRVPQRHQLVVKRVSVRSRRFETLPAVIRRAFASAERRLNELVERRRYEVKSHPQNQMMAVVDRIFRDEGYGFLRSLDGQQIYFHKNSCLHGEWERLTPGTGVRYAEEPGEKGLQASSIEIVNKPGAREMHEGLHELPSVTP